MWGDRTFLIGVGAAKAGTTWLNDYFRGHPDVFVSPIKELHYFDCIFLDRVGFARRWPARLASIEARIDRLEKNPRTEKDEELQKTLKSLTDRAEAMTKRLEFFSDSETSHKNYINYFKHFAKKEKVIGDITPAYGTLPEAAFKAIKKLHGKRKIVFIMRDPIERYYSQLRMTERQAKRDPNKKMKTALERFIPVLNREHRHERGNYRGTIERLEKTFKEDELFFCYFEELFTEETVKKLCAFLEIAFVPGEYGTKSNPSPKDSAIPPAMIKEAKEKFMPQYEFCKAKFGRVPKEWHVQ